MADIKVVGLVRGGILCPNHGCPLEGIGFPMPKKGEGMCPVSGAHFTFEATVDEENTKMVKDKNGNLVKESKFKITGND